MEKKEDFYELKKLGEGVNYCRGSWYSHCARGEGERMRRLIGLVGDAGTDEVRIRRSGAGDLDRGLVDQRSAPERNLYSLLVPVSVCEGFM